MGTWTLARGPQHGRLTVKGQFETMEEAVQAAEDMAAGEVG
jgi:hypothetical protein